TDVTAAPGSEDKRMRRSEFPSVVPYPLSNGSATNLPNVASSLISTTSMLGFSISIIFVKPSFKTTVFLLQMRRDLYFTFATSSYCLSRYCNIKLYVIYHTDTAA